MGEVSRDAHNRISSLDDYSVKDQATIYFRVNSAVISPDDRRALDALALKAMQTTDPTNPCIKQVPYTGVQFVGIPEFQAIGTEVGYGMTGTGLTGAVTFDEQKRGGQNVIDTYYGSGNRIFLSDFENPHSASTNHFGSAIPVDLESLIAPGDSGGGVFVDAAAVADAGAGFGEGAAKRRIEKDRVVAESSVAFRRGRDQAIDRRARFEHDIVGAGECEGADEPCGPVRARTQTFENGREPLGVGGIGAEESRRLDARGSIERVDFNP